jgi:hypothetical protein
MFQWRWEMTKADARKTRKIHPTHPFFFPFTTRLRRLNASDRGLWRQNDEHQAFISLRPACWGKPSADDPPLQQTTGVDVKTIFGRVMLPRVFTPFSSFLQSTF